MAWRDLREDIAELFSELDGYERLDDALERQHSHEIERRREWFQVYYALNKSKITHALREYHKRDRVVSKMQRIHYQIVPAWAGYLTCERCGGRLAMREGYVRPLHIGACIRRSAA